MKAWLHSFFLAQPLVPFALALGAGISLEYWEVFPPLMIRPALALSAVLLVWPAGRIPAAFSFCFFLGAFLYQQRYAPGEGDLRLLIKNNTAIVELRGELLETPTLLENAVGEKTSVRSTARVRVRALRLKEQWHEANGVIMTSTRGVMPDPFFSGREVKVTGVISPPPRARAKGLFDYSRYLYHQRIFYLLRVESAEEWRLSSSEPAHPPVPEQFRAWAKKQISAGLGEDEPVRILWTMVLGLRTAITDEVEEIFMRTGTMHIVAISGLHVACIAGFLVLFCRLLRIPRFRSALLVLPLIWFYTWATGWQSSAVRSAVMASFLLFGYTLMRPTQTLNSLAGAALALLLIQPEQLFQPGFQLSFAVVASLAIFYEPAVNWFEQVTAPDPFVPVSTFSRWEHLLRKSVRLLGQTGAVGAASFFGSLPLTAWYFNLFTPVSLVANILVVPVSSLALLASFIGLMIPPINFLANKVAWIFMWETLVITRWFDAFPFGSFYIPRPGWIFAFVYSGFWLYFWKGRSWPLSVRKCYGGGLLGFVLVSSTVAAARPAPTVVTVFPGNGPAVYIEGPRQLLIDCSSQHEARFLLVPFLHARGQNQLDQLLLTHGDGQHVQGFAEINRVFHPKMIFTSPARARSPVYREIRQFLESRQDKWTVVSAGYVVNGWTALHPTLDEFFPQADDNAVVLFGEIDGWRILLLSDLGERGQRSLMGRHAQLKAEILITGLPGRGQPLIPELLEQLEPKLVILGGDASPFASHSLRSIYERLAQSVPLVLATAEAGAIEIRVEKGTARLEPALAPAIQLKK